MFKVLISFFVYLMQNIFQIFLKEEAHQNFNSLNRLRSPLLLRILKIKLCMFLLYYLIVNIEFHFMKIMCPFLVREKKKNLNWRNIYLILKKTLKIIIIIPMKKF